MAEIERAAVDTSAIKGIPIIWIMGKAEIFVLYLSFRGKVIVYKLCDKVFYKNRIWELGLFWGAACLTENVCFHFYFCWYFFHIVMDEIDTKCDTIVFEIKSQLT
mgnify:CR=1 FL=1